MRSRLKRPEIVTSLFEAIAQDLDLFKATIRQFYTYYADRFGYGLLLHDESLADAHQGYAADIRCMLANVPPGSPSPNHFDYTGVLIFWLRRFPPVHSLRLLLKTNSLSEDVKDLAEDYSSELFAFAAGLGICETFENQGRADSKKVIPGMDIAYYRYICQMIKFKSLSPHAIGAIYKSLFTPLKKRPA